MRRSMNVPMNPNVDRITFWRNFVGRVGSAFCLLFLVSALDGLVSGAREPDNVVRLLPGESVKVNGSLREKLGSVQDLDYASSSDLIRLTFEDLHAGFWLGGYMWRGVLTVSGDIQPGEYSLSVLPRGADISKPSRVFSVQIYPDHQSYRKSDKSFARRYLDLSPWWMFGSFFSLTCVCFTLVYLISHKRGTMLAESGIAEVYFVEQSEHGCRISFGLGSLHGVHSGGEVLVFDPNGATVATARVLECSGTDSTAIVTSEGSISEGSINVGCMISLHGHAA